MNESNRPRRRRARLVRAGALLWIALLAIIACSRFAASLAWPIDLLANLSYAVALPALCTLIAALILKKCKSAAVLTVITLTAIWPVRWMFLPASTSQGASGQDRIVRIISVNVHDQPSAIRNLIPVIEREKPDAVVVIEVGPGLEGLLANDAQINAEYPFALVPTRNQAWRTIMLSRHPMHDIKFDWNEQEFERYKFVYAFRRSVFIDAPAGRFLLSADHPSSPRTASTWQRGNDAVRLLAEVCQKYVLKAQAPVVIAGDFNTTASGLRYRIMAGQSGLKASDRIGGFAGTWPSDWPDVLRLTIDRVWASPDVQFISRRVLDDIGSDHRPILVEMRLPEPAAPDSEHSGQPPEEDGR